MKPNILLITVDQMRADCLHAMGHPVIQTPNLDYLAAKGVSFSKAYSATPTCVPARAAIFTGMSQSSHGRVGYADQVPWNYEHTIAGEFAKAGYHTQCIGKMHVYPTRNLMGFHHVVLHDGYMHYNRVKSAAMLESWEMCDDYLPWLRQQTGSHQDIIDNGLDCNSSVVSKPWHLAEELHPTNWTVTQSIDFLRRRDPANPFFLWMSFVRPHPPLDPPQAFLDLYDPEDIPEAPIGDWVNSAIREDLARNGLNPTTGSGKVQQRMRKRALAAYYALITHIDHQIGRFRQAMYEYGVSDNTIILFTSDHGDMMGDHQLFKKALPYEGSSRIPFILHDPADKLGIQQGTVCEQIVELRDIMPTLLNAADLAIPDTVDGLSLLPLLRTSGVAAENTAVAWRSHIHGEHAYGQLSNHYMTDGKFKYIWFSQSGEEQLFHLTDDPDELHNLAADPGYSSDLKMWRSKLIAELNGREEGYVCEGKLVIGCSPQTSLQHIL